jgi:hypothetical protein
MINMPRDELVNPEPFASIFPPSPDIFQQFDTAKEESLA